MNPRKKPEGFWVIPKGEHQCLWMMAGVIAYKLCEREYQCERCPLDMEMRHAKAGALGRPAGSPKIADEEQALPAALFYNSNHTWVRLEARKGRQRARGCTLLVDGRPVLLKTPLLALVGLDDFIIRLIPRVNGIVLPKPGTRISRGEALATLVQDPHNFKVFSPISGRVVRTNLHLLDHPENMIQNPAQKGWLAYLYPDNFFAEIKDLLESREALSWQQRESQRLEAWVGTYREPDRERLGALMHDGKEAGLDALLERVGPENYYRLVLSFLGQETD